MNIIEKQLNTTFDFIRKFHQSVIISGLPFSNKEAILSIKDRSICADFQITTKEANDNFRLGILDEFSISMNNGEEYRIPPNNGIISGSVNMNDNDDNLQNYQIKIKKLMDTRWNKDSNYYYRMLIPIDDVFWIQNINTYCYKAGNGLYCGWMQLHFPKGTVEVYPVNINQEKFVVIESKMECNFDSMNNILYSIALSLGLVTSFIPLDYSYIIASISPDFTNNLIGGFIQMRNSIDGKRPLFTTNMYYIKDCLKENHAEYALQQLYKNKIFNSSLQGSMQMEEFEKIVLMLYKSEDLSRAALILIESSTMPLDYEGAILSVALETICSALEKFEDKCFIDNEKWKNNIRPYFSNLINSLKGKGLITQDHAKNIENKLNSLNMQSNKNKLSKPFEQINYTLSTQEKKVINSRNQFLHGHLIGSNDEESFNKIMYASLELQKLCAILLFRQSGFKGLIVNAAVLLGLPEAVNAKEPVLV